MYTLDVELKNDILLMLKEKKSVTFASVSKIDLQH